MIWLMLAFALYADAAYTWKAWLFDESRGFLWYWMSIAIIGAEGGAGTYLLVHHL